MYMHANGYIYIIKYNANIYVYNISYVFLWTVKILKYLIFINLIPPRADNMTFSQNFDSNLRRHRKKIPMSVALMSR